MEFKRLFSPGKIGPMELKNRIIFPPICTVFAGEWGQVTDTIIDWYARIARGGAALVVVEVTYTSTAVDNVRQLARQVRADDESYIAGLSCLAEAVHENGAKIGIQFSPGAGVEVSAGPYMLGSIENIPPVSPSGIPAPGLPKKPRILATEEIEKMVELCGQAARRVKQAGFDNIELNAHGGYLIAQFLSTYFNKRTDKYGGSFDNRCRFLLELIAAMRKHVGNELAITVKYSIDEFLEGGSSIEQGQSIAKKLEEVGVDGIIASCGVYGGKIPATPPHYFPPGVLVHLAEAVKQVVKIPVIAVGRLDNPKLAKQVLKDGKADFIGIGRGLMADPDWPQKVSSGRYNEVRGCLACNVCRERLFLAQPLRCAVNAVAGREGRYDKIKPAAEKKKVVIVGAGPGGMEAARVAAIRGHSIVLYEKTAELGGGQLKLAAIPPHKDILGTITKYHAEMFKQLPNIEVRLGKEATAKDVLKDKPDAVIVATGADPLIPDIPGVDKKNVVTAFDVFAGKAKVGKTAVVLGGRTVGCEVANWLAHQGKKITIVARSASAGGGIERWSWLALQNELKEAGVKIMTGTNTLAITDEGVKIADAAGKKSLLKADTVILARGAKPVDNLSGELEGKVKELYTIGDAREPRGIREATSEGYVIAFDL